MWCDEERAEVVWEWWLQQQIKLFSFHKSQTYPAWRRAWPPSNWQREEDSGKSNPANTQIFSGMCDDDENVWMCGWIIDMSHDWEVSVCVHGNTHTTMHYCIHKTDTMRLFFTFSLSVPHYSVFVLCLRAISTLQAIKHLLHPPHQCSMYPIMPQLWFSIHVLRSYPRIKTCSSVLNESS